MTGPDAGLLIGLLLFPLLLLCSALISGSEVAFFSMSVSDIDHMRNDASHSARRIIALLDKPASLLATILISNNFINISIVIVAELLLRRILPIEICIGWAEHASALPLLGEISPEVLGRTFHFLIAVIGVTTLLVLLGEIMPKIYASINTLPLARTMSGPLALLMKLFSPISGIMVRWTDVLEQRLHHLRGETSHSSTELHSAIELTMQQNPEDHKDVDILKRIIQFSDVNTKQIMRPRTDIIAIEREAKFGELLTMVRESGYSRIPVYEEDLDHIIGIIYIKDLIGHLHEADPFQWHGLIRPEILYVPESKRIADLLKEFQKERRHMAIVVDEYGGTSGLVTLEDILEEVVGEIKDEFDDEVEVNFRQLDEHNFVFDAKSPIHDVCRILDVDIHTFDEIKGDADSLAGLVLEIAEVIPRHDTVVDWGGYTFRVTKVNKRRIEEIKLTRPR